MFVLDLPKDEYLCNENILINSLILLF